MKIGVAVVVVVTHLFDLKAVSYYNLFVSLM